MYFRAFQALQIWQNNQELKELSAMGLHPHPKHWSLRTMRNGEQANWHCRMVLQGPRFLLIVQTCRVRFTSFTHLAESHICFAQMSEEIQICGRSSLPAASPTSAVEVGDFAWAKDDYSATWRTVAIWAFIIELRTRLFFIDQAWSYPGGMTPEKCVHTHISR